MSGTGNVRYNLSVEWISVEESTVLHQLDIVEQQLAEINSHESGGYIRVYIRGNASEAEAGGEVASTSALERNEVLNIRNSNLASFSTESLGQAARFAFATTKDENLADLAPDSEEHDDQLDLISTDQNLHVDEDVLDDDDDDILAMSVFPSKSHEDLSASFAARPPADSLRRTPLQHGLMVSTSSSRDVHENSPENHDILEDFFARDDAVIVEKITVRSSNSDERIEASHKGMQAGLAIGNLSGRLTHLPPERRSVRFVDMPHRSGSEQALDGSSRTGGFGLDKVTRSCSTDELTVPGSLQIYDETGTFRIPCSPKSEKRRVEEELSKNNGKGDGVEHRRKSHGTRSSLRHAARAAALLGARRSVSARTSSASGSAVRNAVVAAHGKPGPPFKRSGYNLRSRSMSKRKLRKREAVRT